MTPAPPEFVVAIIADDDVITGNPSISHLTGPPSKLAGARLWLYHNERNFEGL